MTIQDLKGEDEKILEFWNLGYSRCAVILSTSFICSCISLFLGLQTFMAPPLPAPSGPSSCLTSNTSSPCTLTASTSTSRASAYAPTCTSRTSSPATCSTSRTSRCRMPATWASWCRASPRCHGRWPSRSPRGRSGWTTMITSGNGWMDVAWGLQDYQLSLMYVVF